MKILFAASEAVPFVKTGGLGDVAGSLAEALARRGHEVRIVLPKYRLISESAVPGSPRPLFVRVPLPEGDQTVRVTEVRMGPRLRAWLVDAPHYFDRPGVYSDADGREFSDNDRRFILFSRATLEIARAANFSPDVVHAHDWPTGLVPAYLSTLYRNDPFFRGTGSVFTIHNMAYQGVFPKDTLLLAGFSWDEFTPDKMEFYDQINFLKSGIAYAQVVNTVSPSYAAEVRTEAFGQGLDGLLLTRGRDFVGVLNGLDTRRWDPARDPHLARGYTSRTIKHRAFCREDLQRTAGLDVDARAPILGMVSRLDPQKGFDILLDILDRFIHDGCQSVFLGAGSRVFQAALATLARKHPGRVASSSHFDEPLAHKIYGGADIFLMPSRFEPCGLGQMIALRYGAVPVVTPTGGLKDTVAPATPNGGAGVGFVSARVDTASYREALGRAIRLFRSSPSRWRTLQRRGMALSFDWVSSAKRYLELYRLAQDRKLARP
jgi:starch synthase